MSNLKNGTSVFLDVLFSLYEKLPFKIDCEG